MNRLNLRQTAIAFAVAIATLAACQYESTSNSTPTTPTPRGRAARPTAADVSTSHGAVLTATVQPSKPIVPASIATRAVASASPSQAQRVGQRLRVVGHPLVAADTVTPRNYTIGFNFANVFANNEVVVYYERIGSGAMVAAGQYTVAQLTHHVFVAPPNCVAGTSGCVQFNALEIQRDFTIAQFAQPVETHLVSSSTGKSLSAAGITVYQWGQ